MHPGISPKRGLPRGSQDLGQKQRAEDPEHLGTEGPCVPQVFLWDHQRLAGRLPRGSTGDSVLLPLAQGSHRPLSRAQSSPAAPASLPTPEPASQARVLPSSETPARTLPFTTGKNQTSIGWDDGAGGTRRLGACVQVCVTVSGHFFEPQSTLLVLLDPHSVP